MPEINIRIVLLFCIILIPISWFYIAIRNIIILVYTIKYRNMSQEDKISEIENLFLGFCTNFFLSGMVITLFIIGYSSKLIFPLSLLLFILVCIILLLPYIFHLYIHNFLVKKFILNIKKDSLPLWKWIPNIRLNDLYFDKSITEFDTVVLKNYYIYYTSKTDDNEENQVIYQSVIDNSFLKFTEKTHVFVNANISSNLYYQGHNLIGLTLKELEKILNIDDLERSAVGNYNKFKKLNILEEVLEIEYFKVIKDGCYIDYYESKKLNAKFMIDQKVISISIGNYLD